ncbi:MAG TPA: patatin-like phospholipase family protein [Polyangiaceae bacterium]
MRAASAAFAVALGSLAQPPPATDAAVLEAPAASGANAAGEAAPALSAGGSAKIPLAITISGGVSLGAYEGGFLYYLTEVIKRNRAQLDLKVVTGASAGSVNTLLTAMSSCMDTSPPPQQSIFYETWIPIGLEQLLIEGRTTATGLFDRSQMEAIAKTVLGPRWATGFRSDCDLVLGVATTRLNARRSRLGVGATTLPQIEERFAVRMRGRGYGRLPRLDNFIDPNYQMPSALLPTDGSLHDLQSVIDLTFASSTFPLAFEPMRLEHCMTDPPRSVSPVCRPEAAQTDLFVDGGVFDNHPLKLAARVTSGLERDEHGNYRWTDAPDMSTFAIPDELQFLQVDPEAFGYPTETAEDSAPPDSALGLVSKFAANFVESARSKELISLLEARPDIRSRVRMGEAYLPTASGALYAFLGFFETAFRDYDFALGMYDAHRFVQQAKVPLLRPEPRATDAPEEASSKAWAPFFCVRGTLENNGVEARRCADEGLEDFGILLQTSIDRLYAGCRELRNEPRRGPVAHRHCALAMANHTAPHVAGVRAIDARRQQSESDFAHLLRLLAAYRFHFADLGLTRDEAHKARQRIAARIGQLAKEIGAAQSSGNWIWVAAGRVASNSLYYEPPSHVLYVTLGNRPTLGYSLTEAYSDWSWLRLQANVRTDGLYTLLSESHNFVAVAPTLGFEVQPPPLSNASYQLWFGGGAGYQFSTEDAVGFDDCPDEEPVESAPCSGFVVSSHAALSLYEMLRLQVGGMYSPPFDQKAYWSVSAGIGFQFNWD